MSLRSEQVHFPRPTDRSSLTHFDWTLIRYRNVLSVIRNPFYAGAYAYGKSGNKTTIVDGRAHKSYKHPSRLRSGRCCSGNTTRLHRLGEFERNQQAARRNAYGKAGDVKSGRGGQALLAGLLGCARCGRRLSVSLYWTNTATGLPMLSF